MAYDYILDIVIFMINLKNEYEREKLKLFSSLNYVSDNLSEVYIYEIYIGL